jgi:antitoxin component YwqK of YwqJK toxin-antitoxin module
MKYLLFIFIGLLVCSSCSTEETKTIVKQEEEEELVEINDNIYTEWYPGKKQIKFRGGQDDKNQRHGKWSFYSETGLELSVTMYQYGKKEGFTVVKYPNGALHYRGEYLNDEMVGIWTTYDEKGVVANEKDYGYPKN